MKLLRPPKAESPAPSLDMTAPVNIAIRRRAHVQAKYAALLMNTELRAIVEQAVVEYLKAHCPQAIELCDKQYGKGGA